jgi:hypothetical protein
MGVDEEVSASVPGTGGGYGPGVGAVALVEGAYFCGARFYLGRGGGCRGLS